MAHILELMIVDKSDDTIKVGYSFYGLAEAECRTYLREHAANDEYLSAAIREDRVIEELEEVDDDELPDPEDYEEDDELVARRGHDDED